MPESTDTHRIRRLTRERDALRARLDNRADRSKATPLNPGVAVRLVSAPLCIGVVDGWIGPGLIRVAWAAGHRSDVLAATIESVPDVGSKATPHGIECPCPACAPQTRAMQDAEDREHIEGIFEERTNDASSEKYRGLIEDVIDYVKLVRARRPEATNASLDKERIADDLRLFVERCTADGVPVPTALKPLIEDLIHRERHAADMRVAMLRRERASE